MAIRLYIIPVIHIPIDSGGSYNVPAYLPHRLHAATPGLEGVIWAWTTYLLEDIAILIADTTDTQHTLLDVQAGVFPVTNLDDAVPSNLVRNRIRSALEDTYVPGTWINTGDIYRNILRALAGIFEYHNRAVAIAQGRFFTPGTTLNSTISQMTSGQQAALSQAASEFMIDYSSVGASTTLRTIFMLANNLYNASRHYIISGAGMTMEI